MQASIEIRRYVYERKRNTISGQSTSLALLTPRIPDPSPTTTSIVENESPLWASYPHVLLMTVGFLLVALLAVWPDTNSGAVDTPGVMVQSEGGVVNILRAKGGKISQLSDGRQVRIHVNDMVIAETGIATLHFFDGQTTHIHPNARVTIERYESNSTSRRLEYMVWSGQVIHEVETPMSSSEWLRIVTPSSAASIRHGILAIQVISPEQTHYSTTDGSVHITMDGQEQTLLGEAQIVATKGQLFELEPSSMPEKAAGESSTTRSDWWIFHSQGELVKRPGRTPIEPIMIVSDLLAQQSSNGSPISDRNWVSYTVAPGDSLWTIAADYAISVSDLAQANPSLPNPSILQIGDAILIPININ